MTDLGHDHVYILAILKNLPFAVHSLVEVCTTPGSYQRGVAEAVARAVDNDIRRVIKSLEQSGMDVNSKVVIKLD